MSSGGAMVLVRTTSDASDSTSHAFWSAVFTLTNAILGSSVLPLPWAMSRLGISTGLAILFCVAMANAYTGALVIRASGHVGKRTYEAVVSSVFCSTAARILTQIALVSLLFGNLAGDAALLSDTGSLSLRALLRDKAPEWLVHDGRPAMLALICFLVLPLSLSPQMRSLDQASMAGLGLVVALLGIVVWKSIAAGLPAIASGELPLFGFGSKDQVPEAIGVLSFAFYLQPMLLPLLTEMPAGRKGRSITAKALNVVSMIIAFGVYGIVGVFGAARWGLASEGDLMENAWLPPLPEGFLDVGITVYLCIAMAPMAITMRYLLESAMSGGDIPESSSRGRDVALTLTSVAAATGVALIWPRQAEKLFAVTGATAVCLVAYVLPVAVHLKLYFGQRRDPNGRGPTVEERQREQEAWLLEDASMLEAEGEGQLLAPESGAHGHVERRESSVAERKRVSIAGNGGDGGSGGGGDVGQYGEEDDVPVQVLHMVHLQDGEYPHWRDVQGKGAQEKLAAAFWHVGIPLVVLAVGMGTSLLALALSVKKMIKGREEGEGI